MAAVAAAVAPKGPGAEDAGAEDALHHARDASSAGESVDIDVEELDILAGGMPDLSSLTKDLQRCAAPGAVRGPAIARCSARCPPLSRARWFFALSLGLRAGDALRNA